MLELDHFLSDFGQDLDLKRESGRLLLYFVSHLANVSDSDRDILLLLSAVSTFSADETRNIDSSHLSRIFAARSAVAATFLRRKDISGLRQSIKASLGRGSKFFISKNIENKFRKKIENFRTLH